MIDIIMLFILFVFLFYFFRKMKETSEYYKKNRPAYVIVDFDDDE